MDIIYFYYFQKENMFYDENGKPVYNIYEYITPNDFYLFYRDWGNCLFPCKFNKNILIELTTEEENEYDVFEIPCDVCVGTRCRIFSIDKTSRKEICRYCSGRD